MILNSLNGLDDFQQSKFSNNNYLLHCLCREGPYSLNVKACHIQSIEQSISGEEGLTFYNKICIRPYYYTQPSKSYIFSQMIFTCYLKQRATENWNFPGSPVVKTQLPLQGTRIWSLVRELRSHVPCKHNKQKKKKKERKFLEPNKSENIST